ncbi:MAG TPA: hypothetical protein VGS13_16590 [Stellaceae bacterium]|nr:hypothetical protein [Stellaceae bacterium]
MTSVKTVSNVLATADTDDIFFMTNLSPRMTGLPMAVWVSPRGSARHDIRIKVNTTHGNRMTIEDTAVVAVRPAPRVVAGRLTPEDRRLVADWVRLNFEAIIGYWDNELDTGQFLERLKGLPST